MNTTALVMETLLHPVITDPSRQQLAAYVNAELYPLKWDDKKKTLSCIARFCSSFHMPDHLLWHRETIAAALNTVRHIKAKIVTPDVKEHRIPSGRYQEYVELEIHYLQNFPTFPSPDCVMNPDSMSSNFQAY